MNKIATMALFFLCFNIICFADISEKQKRTFNLSIDNFSGLYKGIYFFEDVGGATERMDVEPVILMNDTCSYLLIGGVLEKNISIKNDLISFGNAEYPGQIYIGEGTIEDDGVRGVVFTKTGVMANGMVMKVSDITDNEMNRINNAIEEERKFIDVWRAFKEALNADNAKLLAEYVHFPFEDVYGRYYPKIVSKGAFDIGTKSEFIKQFSNMFTPNVKEFLNKNIPVKLYRYEVYYISVPGFRPFNFEKINGDWKLTKFPYEE